MISLNRVGKTHLPYSRAGHPSALLTYFRWVPVCIKKDGKIHGFFRLLFFEHKQNDKPGYVAPPKRRGNGHLSRMTVASHLKQPT